MTHNLPETTQKSSGIDVTPADLPALALAINEEHALAERHAELAIHRAKRAGDMLVAAKQQIQHGQWLPWLATNCPTIKERTARAYMRLARNWEALESKSADSAVLTIDAALKLLAEPRDESETAPITLDDLIALDEHAKAINESADRLGECMTDIASLVRKMRDGIGPHFGGFENWCSQELGLDPKLRDMLLDPARRWHPRGMDEEQHTLMLLWMLRGNGYSEHEARSILAEGTAK